VTVVSDTSVLLNLCLIGQQEILRVFFKQVWVPAEVKLEPLTGDGMKLDFGSRRRWSCVPFKKWAKRKVFLP
jgi:hypothetical protein